MSMIMFYVTFPDEAVAAELSDKLITERLIACSNIHPIKSAYWWKGNIENDDEWVAVYKTSFSNIHHVESFIETHHPYEVPCILRWEFDCNLAYEKWLRSNIDERK